MPLFTFICDKCGHVTEKFFHKIADEEEPSVKCKECGSTECKRQFSAFGNRVWMSAKDLYNNKIAPDAKNIMDKMKKGSDKDFFDIYGDK